MLTVIYWKHNNRYQFQNSEQGPWLKNFKKQIFQNHWNNGSNVIIKENELQKGLISNLIRRGAVFPTYFSNMIITKMYCKKTTNSMTVIAQVNMRKFQIYTRCGNDTWRVWEIELTIYYSYVVWIYMLLLNMSIENWFKVYMSIRR